MYRRLNILLLIAVVLLIAVASTQADTNCPSNLSLADGISALYAHQYPEAIDIFSCLIQIDAQNADAYLWRGRAYVLNGDWFAAQAEYQAASLYLTGQYLVWELQERDFAHMIDTNPDDVAGYILRAHWFWLASRDTQALSDYNHILRLDPDNIFALTYRGSSRMTLGLEGAEEDWQRALELAPDNPEIYEVIGPTYRYMGKLDESLSYLTQGIDAAPEYPYLYESRGLTYAARRAYSLAIADENHALNLGLPQTERVWVLTELGRMQLQANLTDDADASFAQAEATMPGSAWVSYLRGGVLDAVGEPQEAIDAYRSFVERLPVVHIQTELQQIGVPRFTMLVGNAESVFDLPINLTAGQTLRIEANAVDENVDPLILLVNPDGSTAAASNNADAEGNIDSLIDRFVVPQDGRYTLFLVSTFDSASGAATVVVKTDT